MKNFKILLMALVAMCGLNSCSDDCNHDFIEHDYTQDLVGTWTYLEEGQAEAMVIKADGSFTITGVMKHGALYEEKGTIKAENNKVTLTYESGDVFDGRIELVAGKSMSIVFNKEYDVCLTYDYCENDLSDEIVGMWVSTDAPTANGNIMTVQTYKENGKATYTGFGSYVDEFLINDETNYKVVGDLLFYELPQNMLPEGVYPYIIKRLTYAPNGNALGDLMVQKSKKMVDGKEVERVSTMLRVKQNLNLAGKKYDYTKTFVTNAKGEDKDIPFLDTSFNFAKMDGSIIDKFLKSILFSVEFPDANTLKYSYLIEGEEIVMAAPIEVEGNKMTVKMSENVPFYQDVEIYTFQDQDNTQMHLYIPTASFEKFFANTCVAVLLGYGDLDINDTEAIAGVYQNVADALESINLSIVMHSNK